VTQCVDPARLWIGGEVNKKMLRPSCGNLFKQIMTKLGYAPWNVSVNQLSKHEVFKGAKGLTMIVGVVVSLDRKARTAWNEKYGAGGDTPSGGSKTTVAFCASYNDNFTQFNNFIRYQDKHQDHVTDSARLMTKAMEGFKAKNKGRYPTSVVVYREGVSNSQLGPYQDLELRAYDEAFQGLGVRPLLSVVVVQKRVSTRFFLPCGKTQGSKCLDPFCNGNEKFHSPPPGSVVDVNVVSPTFNDFFLVPSQAPKGATARPTRFIVIRDDHQFSMDQIQSLTNHLCYGYLNWSGPIRVPAPVMNAHRLAYLFAKHVSGDIHQNLKDMVFYL